MKAIRTISIILVFLLLLIISNTSCSTDVDRTKSDLSDLDVEKIDEPKIIVDDIPKDIQDFEIDTQE